MEFPRNIRLRRLLISFLYLITKVAKLKLQYFGHAARVDRMHWNVV